MTHPTVAILGLGPMGRALAAASLAAGHSTVVWNRSPDKAAPLLARGAVLAPTAAEAAGEASLVIVCLINYAAVRAVLTGSAAGQRVPQLGVDQRRLLPGGQGTLVNLSSGHAAEARDLAGWAAQRGVAYLDGAILTPAPTIGTPAATILYSGPRELFDRSLPLLEVFGGSSIHLGADPGTAAGYEMALLDLFAMSVGGLAHAFALAIAEGIPPAAFARFAGGMGSLLPELAGRFADQLTSGDFTADVSTIASASSAVAHVRDAAVARGIDTTPLEAVQSIIHRAVVAGHGDSSYARLTQVLVGVRAE